MVGAVLGQKKEGLTHAIYYASKTLDGAQLNYATTEKELLAVVYTFEKLCSYLVGAKVIVSHHNFQETPASGTLFMLLEQMNRSNADIVKLAVMPQCSDDVLRLLSETSHFHKRYPMQPLVTMSMGNLGAVSRICGELFGSCVTFGAGKNASAPGQIEMAKLEEILQVLRLS